MTVFCDGCEKPVKGFPMEVRIPRPSDPGDLCCIATGCAECYPYSEGTSMTWGQWLRYMESDEARKNGHIFLT